MTSVTDPLNNVVRSEYDNNGNRTRTYDARNFSTTFAYDNRDRPTSITDALNGITRYEYDAVSNLTRITNARNYATSFTYDNASRLTQVTDALNQATTYTYDQVGNRTQLRDRKTQLSTYTYDQANRLTQVAAGGTTITYTYDPNGNRTAMADVTGTTSYTYDSLDRLTRTTYPDAMTVQATYDRAGNRTALTNPGGLTMAAAYDAANRLTQLIQGTLTWTFGYDAAGNRSQQTYPNGTSTIYSYQSNNWLATISHRSPSGSQFWYFQYTYDANGNRLTQNDASGTATFTYDALNRLTAATYPGPSTTSWTYDPVGNRTLQSAPNGTVVYAYDGNNRLTTADTTAYTYDANGNLTGISTGPVTSFTYDVFNRLTQTAGSSGAVTYTYNGDGLKVTRSLSGATTRYYYDGIRPILELDGGRNLLAQLDRDIFGNLLSRKEASGTRYELHADGLGSISALTSHNGGAVAATMLYDAWGNLRSSPSGAHGTYRFTGAEWDSTTGLYHMGARFYDPTIGRWLSEDPVQDKPFEPLTLNFYAYVQGNPMIFTDPDGKVALPVITGLIGAGVGLGAYLATHRGSVTVGGALLAMGAGALAGMGLGALMSALGPGAGALLASEVGGIRLAVQAGVRDYGVTSYNVQQGITRGWNHVIEAHHIIPARFADMFNTTRDKMASVILPHDVHRMLDRLINEQLNPRNQYTKEQVLQALRNIYSRWASELLEYLR